MKIKINIHEHYWDCETCGGAGSTTYAFSSDEIGEFEDGTPPTCFSGRDGDIVTVISEMNKRINALGIDTKIHELSEDFYTLENEHIKHMDSVNWDSEKLTQEQVDLYERYNAIYTEHENFYEDDALIAFYSLHGIELSFEYTCDEIESDDDWDDDEHDEYYSELFDNGYTTDDSYEDNT